MGKGQDVGVGGFFAAFIEERGEQLAIFDAQAAEGRTKGDFPALLFDGGAAAFVELAERDGGDAHAVASLVGENGFPENVDAIAGVDAIEFFGKRADENDAPEAGDGGWSLFVAAEPFEHRDAAGFVDVGRMAAALQDGIESAGDGKLVFQCQRRKREERASHMKRRGEDARVHFAAAALRIEKNKAVEEFDFACGADAAIEVFEVGAAAEGDVLAIVDVLAIGQDVGSRASAKKRALLKETNAPARFSQRDAGCQSRQPAADHDHAFQGYSLPRGGRSAPLR